MTLLSGKRVRYLIRNNVQTAERQSACVSALLVSEIKRIIKESEIMKLVDLVVRGNGRSLTSI